MYKALAIAVAVSLGGLWAARDSQQKMEVEVQPGWTLAKAEFSNQWSGMDQSEKENMIRSFEQRLGELAPDVTDFKSDPKSEDGGEDFYPAVKGMISQLSNDLDNGWLAARIDEMLTQAENVVQYRKTHPFTGQGPEVISLTPSEETHKDYTPFAEGDGWITRWVQPTSDTSETNPVICQAGNYLFAATTQNDTTIRIYRSTDQGASWDYWALFYLPGASGYPSSIIYDVQQSTLLVSANFYSSGNMNIYVARYTDIDDPNSFTGVWVANTSDDEAQGQLSVEYTSNFNRICLFYHNNTTGEDVVARSADHGATWNTEFTSSWTGSWFGAPKGAQGGNGGSGLDRFLFVTANGTDSASIRVVESGSGMSGAWAVTDLTDPFYRKVNRNVDIAGSHSFATPGAIAVYEAVYTDGRHSIRGWWQAASDSTFHHFFVDDFSSSNSLRSPSVCVDGEWTGDLPPTTNMYHAAYFTDIDADGNYQVAALACPNDWSLIGASSDWWDNSYREQWLGDSVSAITANYIWDYGSPAFWYQIDNTTFATGNATTPFTTSIVWREQLGNDVVLSSTVNTSSGTEERPGQDSGLALRPVSGNTPLVNLILPSAGHATVKIYDAKGALVEDLSGEYQAGLNRIAPHLSAAGSYFAVVNFNGKTITGTLLLTR